MCKRVVVALKKKKNRTKNRKKIEKKIEPFESAKTTCPESTVRLWLNCSDLCVSNLYFCTTKARKLSTGSKQSAARSY